MANLITGARILCSLILLFFPTFSTWFYVFYVIGGLSDVLDGWTARRLGEVSDFGARLDTVADILFFGVVLIKVFCSVNFPFWVVLWVICIAALRITALSYPIVHWIFPRASSNRHNHHYMRHSHCCFHSGITQHKYILI